MFFNHLAPALADNGNASGDIEKIVVTPDNVRTVYYKNGTVHHYLTIDASVNLNVGVSSGTAHVVGVIPPPPFPTDEIAQMVKQIIEGVFGSLGVGSIVLAAEILILLRRLRHNRPKDYNGLICEGTSACAKCLESDKSIYTKKALYRLIQRKTFWSCSIG